MDILLGSNNLKIFQVLKIAITGPESCGKTTLSEALAEILNAELIPEYAREFLTELNREYTYADLSIIADNHHKNTTKPQNSIRIIDTDFIVMEIWSEERFGKVSDDITKMVESDLFDLHILCSPDIPYEDDPLRENPNDRERLFEVYQSKLLKHNKNHIIVTGSHAERVEKSLKHINSL